MKNRKWKVNEKYFENIDNSEKAYWLGFIAADGCIIKDKINNTYRLEISLAIKDLLHLKQFRKNIELEKEVTIRKDYKSCYIRVNSTSLCKDLIKLGITPAKSKTLMFPKTLNEYTKDFIRGYFDGDGCVTISGKKSNNDYKLLKTKLFILGTENILKGIIDSSNINVKYHKRSDANVHYMNVTTKDKVESFYNYIYFENCVCLSRKKEMFETGLPRWNKKVPIDFKYNPKCKVHVKQGELLETPEEDNQQPSLIRNDFEGSTTNLRVLTSNVEDSNEDTSALLSKEMMI